jgi:hypothetical protein
LETPPSLSFGTARALLFGRFRHPPLRKQVNLHRLEAACIYSCDWQLSHRQERAWILNLEKTRGAKQAKANEINGLHLPPPNRHLPFHLSPSMASSPPTYTSLSSTNSSSYHKNQAVFFSLIVAPYALLSLFIPITASLSRILPFLLFSSGIHFFTHPYLISRVFPSFSPDSHEGQSRLWTAGNLQLASLLTLAVGLVGARVESISENQLGGLFVLFVFGGGGAFAAWNGGTQPSSFFCPRGLQVFPFIVKLKEYLRFLAYF